MVLVNVGVIVANYNLPVLAPTNTLDTQHLYRTELVSLGSRYLVTLSDSTLVDFSDNNDKYVNSLDERNLLFCKYLSIYSSRIAHVHTELLANLRVLVIRQTPVKVLNTTELVLLEHLNAGETGLSELLTVTM